MNAQSVCYNVTNEPGKIASGNQECITCRVPKIGEVWLENKDKSSWRFSMNETLIAGFAKSDSLFTLIV